MQGIASWALIVGACVAANVPFATQRIFGVVPLKGDKSFVVCFAEWIAALMAVLFVAILVESGFGQRAPQSWEFFVAWICVFCCMAFPGFVWRFLKKESPRLLKDIRE